MRRRNGGGSSESNSPTPPPGSANAAGGRIGTGSLGWARRRRRRCRQLSVTVWLLSTPRSRRRRIDLFSCRTTPRHTGIASTIRLRWLSLYRACRLLPCRPLPMTTSLPCIEYIPLITLVGEAYDQGLDFGVFRIDCSMPSRTPQTHISTVFFLHDTYRRNR